MAEPGADADPLNGRPETADQRHDRNWAELLQELRVLQTGTQILTGFLLTVVFQPRFATLRWWEIATYLGLVVVAVLATLLGLAPVALHRLLFQRRAKGEMVAIADRLIRVTLAAVALLFAGTAGLIFDVAIGPGAALVAVIGALTAAAGLWLGLPLRARSAIRRAEEPG